jgi:hypothetical protein
MVFRVFADYGVLVGDTVMVGEGLGVFVDVGVGVGGGLKNCSPEISRLGSTCRETAATQQGSW